MTTPRRPLTDLDIEVLRGAQLKTLWRSESGRDLYASYLDAFGRSTKVNRQVDKLSGGDQPLIYIGDQERLVRRWRLTDAGEAELAKRDGS